MTQFILGVIEITLTMSAVIALLLLLSKLFGRRFTAQCRYLVWAIVMIRLCVPFGTAFLPSLVEVKLPVEVTQSVAETAPVPLPANDQPSAALPEQTPFAAVTQTTVVPTAETGTTEIQSMLPETHISEEAPVPMFEMPSAGTILTVCGYVWLAGAAVYLLIELAKYAVSMHRLKKALSPASQEAAALYKQLCGKQKLRRAPALYVSTLVSSPMLCGYVRPRIVLPDIELSPNSLAGILAHELIHYRRNDLWVKLLCVFATSLHWFNPLVHIAAKRCNNEIELSCDERVLAGLGGDARISYGNVMLDIIKRCRRPDGTLTTQFNPKKSAVKERFNNILDMTNKKRGLWIIAVVAAVCVIAGTVIGCSIGLPNTDDASKDYTTLERNGMLIPMPEKYTDRLYIPDEATRKWYPDSVIAEFYEKRSYDEYFADHSSAGGLLFGILRYDTAQYERYLCSDSSGLNFFAKEGGYYYGAFISTSMEFYRSGISSYENLDFSPWEELMAQKDAVIDKFIDLNGLQEYNNAEFKSREYTYDSEHIRVAYYPYYTTDQSRDIKYTFVLSQPEKQGADGIWCVERWYDEGGNLHYYFPSANETDLPASEYYYGLQADCDSGKRGELLEPITVSQDFAESCFGHTPVIKSFELLEASGNELTSGEGDGGAPTVYEITADEFIRYRELQKADDRYTLRFTDRSDAELTIVTDAEGYPSCIKIKANGQTRDFGQNPIALYGNFELDIFEASGMTVFDKLSYGYGDTYVFYKGGVYTIGDRYSVGLPYTTYLYAENGSLRFCRQSAQINQADLVQTGFWAIVQTITSRDDFFCSYGDFSIDGDGNAVFTEDKRQTLSDVYDLDAEYAEFKNLNPDYFSGTLDELIAKNSRSVPGGAPQALITYLYNGYLPQGATEILYCEKICMCPYYIILFRTSPKSVCVYMIWDDLTRYNPVSVVIPDGYDYDSAEAIWTGGRGGSGESRFWVELEKNGVYTYLCYDNYASDAIFDYRFDGEVPSDELLSYYNELGVPVKFPNTNAPDASAAEDITIIK